MYLIVKTMKIKLSLHKMFSHNAKILKAQNTSETRCNFCDKQTCPLNVACLINNVV